MHIPYLEKLTGVNAQTASTHLNQEIPSYWINRINWSVAYPYCPHSRLFVAHSGKDLYLKFQILENNIKATYLHDQEPVWEDSCVEFFCKKNGSDSYMNFEFNCIGACLATTRKGRSVDVVPLSEEQMNQIERYSTLGRQTFAEKEGLHYWELTVKIPFTVLNLDVNDLAKGLMGNFYKCADGSSTPHYVSWSPILTEAPDFHCPTYFGKLVFGK